MRNPITWLLGEGIAKPIPKRREFIRYKHPAPQRIRLKHKATFVLRHDEVTDLYMLLSRPTNDQEQLKKAKRFQRMLLPRVREKATEKAKRKTK